ncbi:MAG: LysM peptidoglycan-binding domain-containing protein [Elusimicrobiales bacterium]
MKSVFLIFFCHVVAFLFCQEEFQSVRVKPGQTLWDISQIYLKDPTKWDEIVKYNNLPKDPYYVLTGKEIKIPIRLVKEEYRAARFDKIIGDVRLRGVDSSLWRNAKDVKDVFKGDMVKTGDDSYADIRFYTGQLLNIFSNSMVVVKPPSSYNSDLKLMAGQIKAKDTKIITASARIVPKVKNTEIGAKIREDLTTVVRVYRGEAEVEGKGKKVSLKEGFVTEVRLDSSPLPPQKIPDILTAKMPAVETRVERNIVEVKVVEVPKTPKDIKVKEVEKDQRFDLEENIKIDLSKAISGYHIQVAKDIEFKNIVLDRRFEIFRQVNLKDYLYRGRYYLRVAYIDLIGFEGEFSKPKEIEID